MSPSGAKAPVSGMIDVSAKSPRLRTATAEGRLYCSPQTIARVQAGDLPKGDLFATARAAGLLAAKRTPDLIPHCHPLRIEGMTVDFEAEEGTGPNAGRGILTVRVWLKSIDRTGPEVEAIMATMVTLGVAYDLLKPIDDDLLIGDVRVVEKTGGKSDPRLRVREGLNALVVACSDAVASGAKVNSAAEAAAARLARAGLDVEVLESLGLVPAALEAGLRAALSREPGLLVTVGGVGATAVDCVPEVLAALGGRLLPGIGERMRAHGTDRTALAMFTRPEAWAFGRTLAVALPGSTSGAVESLDAVLPGLFQAARMLAKKPDPPSG